MPFYEDYIMHHGVKGQSGVCEGTNIQTDR